MTESRRPTGDFRPDLEGLRGVAILLVLLFHAGIPGTRGGFVGVDVFFVLSGFLITGLLLRERETTGRVDLREFYARRARRILPAASVVLVGIVLASPLFMAPLDLPRVAGDAVASALFVGNVWFAAGATDYFGIDLAPSPVIHYWSLGVEEQFYLLWPALLIVVTRFGRPRAAVGVTLIAVVLVSYVGALWLTSVAPAWAFYSLPTRAWELGLGGLLAASAGAHARLPDRVARPLGWLGLIAILAALLLIAPTTPYPGIAALLPALGTAAVILAGARARSVGTVLATPALRFLGLISFSLYLVHWPILVLPAAALPLDEELPLLARGGLGLLAIGVGWLSFRLVEHPIHRGRTLAARPRLTFAAAGLALLLTVSVSGGLGLAASRGLDDETAVLPDPSASPEPLASIVIETFPPEPSASPAPGSSAEPSAAPPPTASPAATPSGPVPLPPNVRPSLAKAPSDSDTLEADICLLGQPQVVPVDCVYGDKKGSKTVAVVGDSHAAHWFPALEPLAKAHGWRLVPFIKQSCRFLDMPLYSYWYGRMYRECDTWRETVVQRVKDLKPDLVIIAFIGDKESSTASDPDPVHQGEAAARLIGRLPGPKAIFVDTPGSKYNVPYCLSRHREDVRECETRRAKAFGKDPGVVERTAAELLGATLIDVTPLMCPGDPCPVVLNRVIVYRDSHHMTATFAASLAPLIEPALLAALESGPG
jgi:peptidoglycan/LPS O-acetylase OafA/YrhL